MRSCYTGPMSTENHLKERNLQDWLTEYAVSHQNTVNVMLHKVCVPLIFWSLLGMIAGFNHWIGFLVMAVICVSGLVFYARLSLLISAVMLIVLFLCNLSYLLLLDAGVPLFWTSLGIFAVAWVGQFIGHGIEGRKPSFFQDLQFLLIGPLWVFYSFRPR